MIKLTIVVMCGLLVACPLARAQATGCSRPPTVGTLDWNRMSADQQVAACRAAGPQAPPTNATARLPQDVKDGATPRDVRTTLGIPSEVVVDNGRTTWRYVVSNQARDILFIDGRVSAIPTGPTASPPSQVPPMLAYAQVHGLAQYHLNANHLESAIQYAPPHPVAARRA